MPVLLNPSRFASGGSTPPLSVIQSGTYGDDFTGASLAAKWSRVGVLATEETYAQDSGQWMYWTGSRGQGSYWYQAAPAGDFEVICALRATVSGSSMIGAVILDNSGNGAAGVIYNDSPDGPFVASVTSGHYGGQFTSATGPTGTTFYGGTQPEVWFRLKKTGTGYQLATSTDGTAWQALSSSLTRSFTPTRIGFGCIWGTMTSLKIDMFDVR